jgi:hypothetical protein
VILPPRLLLGYGLVVGAGLILGVELMTLLGAVGARAGASEAAPAAAPGAWYDTPLAAAFVHAGWVALAAALAVAGWRLLYGRPRP